MTYWTRGKTNKMLRNTGATRKHVVYYGKHVSHKKLRELNGKYRDMSKAVGVYQVATTLDQNELACG